MILLFSSLPVTIKTRKKAPQPVGDYPFEFTVVDHCGDYDKMNFTVRVIKDVSIITSLFLLVHMNKHCSYDTRTCKNRGIWDRCNFKI